MYKFLKRIIIVLSLLIILVSGTIFLYFYQNQMFAGQQQIIYVEKSKIDLSDTLNNIAEQNHILIAKRIVESTDNGTGTQINTYSKIGKGTLPNGLPLQKNKSLIENSPDTTAYVIIGKGITSEKVSDILNAKGNKSAPISNNHILILIQNLPLYPQASFGFIILLFAFASLIIAEHISEIKSVGVKRLAGMSKHSIAFHKTFKEGMVLV